MDVEDGEGSKEGLAIASHNDAQICADVWIQEGVQSSTKSALEVSIAWFLSLVFPRKNQSM